MLVRPDRRIRCVVWFRAGTRPARRRICQPSQPKVQARHIQRDEIGIKHRWRFGGLEFSGYIGASSGFLGRGMFHCSSDVFGLTF